MARKRKGDKVDGWVALDKPIGLTSTQALGRIRRILNAQKAGHAGTLDPLATGCLPIALGEATKTIPFAQDHIKTYTFTVRWGETRDTDDAEGAVTATSEVRPTREQIEAILPSYEGEIEQVPPRFSAIKIDGQRAYDLARAGEDVEISSRMVYIESLRLLDCRDDEADFETVCGKGTYVRSLARDMAADLGTCGYIIALHRVSVGPFGPENMISLDKLEKLDHSAALGEALLPLETVLDDIPALAVKEDEGARLRSGQVLAFVSRQDFGRLEQAGIEGAGKGTIHEALVICKGRAVCIAEIEGAEVRPVKVFNL